MNTAILPELIDRKIAAELLRRLATEIEMCKRVRMVKHNDYSAIGYQMITVEWEPALDGHPMNEY